MPVPANTHLRRHRGDGTQLHNSAPIGHQPELALISCYTDLIRLLYYAERERRVRNSELLRLSLLTTSIPMRHYYVLITHFNISCVLLVQTSNDVSCSARVLLPETTLRRKHGEKFLEISRKSIVR